MTTGPSEKTENRFPTIFLPNMKLPRYKQLSALNRFFYLAAIATFIGLFLSVVSFLKPLGETNFGVKSPQTFGDNSPQYIGGKNSTFNFTEVPQLPETVGEQTAWKTRSVVIACIVGVCVLIAILLALNWGRDTHSNTTAITTTSGKYSPQFIGGNNSTFNLRVSAPDVPNDIQAILEKRRLLPSKLTERYPFGWVLFHYDPGGQWAPFSVGELECDADWQQTRLQLDTENKQYSLIVPELRWRREPQTFNVNERRVRPYKGKYEIGKSTLLPTMVWAEGEPLAHLEILDDTLRSPVFVIGFKKQPPGSGPPVPVSRNSESKMK